MEAIAVVLGSEVSHKITNFNGVVVSISKWLYGDDRIGVQSKELKDGKPLPVQWFDAGELEVI